MEGRAFDPWDVRAIAAPGHPESMDREIGLLGEGFVEVRSSGGGRNGYLFGERLDGFACLYSTLCKLLSVLHSEHR